MIAKLDPRTLQDQFIIFWLPHQASKHTKQASESSSEHYTLKSDYKVNIFAFVGKSGLLEKDPTQTQW